MKKFLKNLNPSGPSSRHTTPRDSASSRCSAAIMVEQPSARATSGAVMAAPREAATASATAAPTAKEAEEVEGGRAVLEAGLIREAELAEARAGLGGAGVWEGGRGFTRSEMVAHTWASECAALRTATRPEGKVLRARGRWSCGGAAGTGAAGTGAAAGVTGGVCVQWVGCACSVWVYVQCYEGLIKPWMPQGST